MTQVRALTQRDEPEFHRIVQRAFISVERMADYEESIKRFPVEEFLGAFIDDTLVSLLKLIPMEITMGESSSQALKMGGYAFVATPPEFRNQGYVRDLMIHSMNEMFAKEYPISYLYPFSYAFYRQFGFEEACSSQAVEINPDIIQPSVDIPGSFKQVSKEEYPILDRIYNAYAKNYNGMVKRTPNLWQHFILQNLFKKNENIIYIYYDSNQTPVGYIIYAIRTPNPLELRAFMQVREMIWATEEAKWALWNFLARFRGQVESIKLDLPLDEPITQYCSTPRFTHTYRDLFMARIIHIQKALTHRTYAHEDEMVLTIADAQLEENNGSYKIQQTAHAAPTCEKLTSPPSSPDLECSIASFTQIYLGYLTVEQAYRAGKLINPNPEKIKRCAPFFHTQLPFIRDFF